jgi:hypothetical protein
MLLIAHRALVNGPDKQLENHPHQIQQCLSSQLDVEIDVWLQDNKWYLGHDKPTYETNLSFLLTPGLWIHAKNTSASFELLSLVRQGHLMNFFWHENDQRTLTSQGFWWTFPGQQLGPLSVAVMPEWHTPDVPAWASKQSCYGICSDFVGSIKR